MAARDHTQRLVTVYGLASSEDGKIRYVGQTVYSIAKRLREHTRRELHTRTYKARWIRQVLNSGYRVLVFEIERDAVIHEAEVRLIAWYREHGARLVNSTRGGDGLVGLLRTPEHRKRIGDAQRGQKRQPLADETKAKLSAILSVRVFTPEHRARISEARKAQGISPDAQAKMKEARLKSSLWRNSVIQANSSRKGTKHRKDL